jgi:hypothetical protein
MWRSSLISRSVRLASILLSKALPIFLTATCSPVSELSAELPHTHRERRTSERRTGTTRESEEGDGPDDAVGALADGEDGGLVLGGDLEHVTEDVVLDEPAAVAQSRLDVLRHASAPRRLRGRRRLLPSCRTAGAGFHHLRVRRLRPAVHGRIWITARKGRESGGGRRRSGGDLVAVVRTSFLAAAPLVPLALVFFRSFLLFIFYPFSSLELLLLPSCPPDSDACISVMHACYPTLSV